MPAARDEESPRRSDRPRSLQARMHLLMLLALQEHEALPYIELRRRLAEDRLVADHYRGAEAGLRVSFSKDVDALERAGMLRRVGRDQGAGQWLAREFTLPALVLWDQESPVADHFPPEVVKALEDEPPMPWSTDERSAEQRYLALSEWEALRQHLGPSPGQRLLARLVNMAERQLSTAERKGGSERIFVVNRSLLPSVAQSHQAIDEGVWADLCQSLREARLVKLRLRRKPYRTQAEAFDAVQAWLPLGLLWHHGRAHVVLLREGGAGDLCYVLPVHRIAPDGLKVSFATRFQGHKSFRRLQQKAWHAFAARNACCWGLDASDPLDATEAEALQTLWLFAYGGADRALEEEPGYPAGADLSVWRGRGPGALAKKRGLWLRLRTRQGPHFQRWLAGWAGKVVLLPDGPEPPPEASAFTVG